MSARTRLRAAHAIGLVALLCAVAGCPGPSSSVPPQTPAAGVAVSDGAVLLRRVVEAERSCAYTGYIRMIHGESGEGRATRMKVSHSAAGRTRLEWAEGDEDARCFEYGNRFAWLADPELLLANYEITLDPADSPAVAWRETRRLVVRSRRPARPSLELLVDRETSLVLEARMRDFEGRPWLTTVFDTIDYRAPAAFPDEAELEPLAPPASNPAGGADLPLALFAPPAGFVRIAADTSVPASRREDWSDGLAAFSIVQRTGADAGEGPAEGELHRRACSNRGSVSGLFGGISVTVVGNLPVAELEAVVRSLAPSR